jgi:hypothetical protein
MIKFFFIIALVTGGVFAFNVLEEIHNENPEILAELNEAWQEVTNGDHEGSFRSTNASGRNDFASTAAARPNTMKYAVKNANQVDVGAARPNTWNNNRRSDTNDLATARRNWQNAVRSLNRIIATRGSRAQGQAAYQEVQRTKRIYNNILARSSAARR